MGDIVMGGKSIEASKSRSIGGSVGASGWLVVEGLGEDFGDGSLKSGIWERGGGDVYED